VGVRNSGCRVSDVGCLHRRTSDGLAHVPVPGAIPWCHSVSYFLHHRVRALQYGEKLLMAKGVTRASR